MGKKKGKKHGHGEHRRHAEDAYGHDRRAHDGMPGGIPPQVAGIAAAALKQVNTPAFQHLIAGALGAAGKAMEEMAQRSASHGRGTASAPPRPPEPPVPPVPPTPPIPPVPPIPPEPQAAYRPQFDTGSVTISPEAAEAIERVAHQAAEAIERAAESASRAIETAAAGFERWVEAKTRKGP